MRTAMTATTVYQPCATSRGFKQSAVPGTFSELILPARKSEFESCKMIEKLSDSELSKKHLAGLRVLYLSIFSFILSLPLSSSLFSLSSSLLLSCLSSVIFSCLVLSLLFHLLRVSSLLFHLLLS